MKKSLKIYFKIIMAVLVICLAFPMCFSNVYASPNATVFELNGAGTESNPYKISSPAQLKNFATNVQSGNNYDGKFVVLENDITFNGTEYFSPIGYTSSNCFKGTFDGQGHTISKININLSSYCYAGLFGYIRAIDNVVIKNLVIEDFNAIGTHPSQNVAVGAVIGFCELDRSDIEDYKSCQLENIAVKSGNIDAHGSKNVFAGGLVGQTSVTINNKTVMTENEFTDTLKIKYCWSNISISVSTTTNTIYYAASLSGTIGCGFAMIENCYSWNNPMISNLINASNYTGLLLVRYCYEKLDTTIEYYTYYTQFSIGSAPIIGTTNSLQVLYEDEICISQNSNRNKWILVDTNNDGTDDILVLKNVGYTVNYGTVNAKNQYYNISTNSWEFINESTKNITVGDVITSTNIENKNRKYLQKIDKPYFTLSNSTDSLNITTETFTITQEHIDNYDGGTLYTNYINGYPITINGTEFWFCTDNKNLYTYSNNIFTNISSGSNALFPTQDGKYLLGWSTTKPLDTCDLANKTINGVYTDWFCDYNLVIENIYGNMQSSNGTNKEITNYTINEEFFTTNKNVKIYPVWGDLKIRVYTDVYKYVNGQELVCDNVFVNSNASKQKNYFRVNTATCDFTLKDTLNNTIILNNGYNAISWSIVDTGSQFGTLSKNSGDTTTLSNFTSSTTVKVLLTPVANLSIVINNNEFEGEENVRYTLKHILPDSTEDVASEILAGEIIANIIYGEKYTIVANNIPEGWYLKHAYIENANTKFSYTSNSCTFEINSNQAVLKVNVDILEGFFTGLLLDVAIAVLIVGLSIIILGTLINNYKPVEQYVASPNNYTSTTKITPPTPAKKGNTNSNGVSNEKFTLDDE